MEFLQRLLRQLGQVWQGMGLGQRVAMVAVTLASLALMIGVIYWSAQPDYRVLFSGLSLEDAGAVTSKLQTQNVPFRLTSGGTSVLVPAEQVQQLRVDLAMEGLPGKGGKGFELFDESPLGMTPFTQHVNYLRALQAELAKTISQIEPVVFARVHVVRPEPSPFVREQKSTTASVVLRLRPGSTLSRSTAAGIVALVARGVEGLSPENVTLLDASGRVLSESPNAEAGIASTQLEYRRNLEAYLTAKAEEMLAQLLGPGRSIVRVTADINFQRLKERQETYNPEGRVVSSEKITSGKSSSTTGPPRGAAGTASNVPSRTLATPGSAPTTPTSTQQDESVQTDYKVSMVVRELEDKLGSVERLTVAAMVDLKGDGTVTTMSLNDVQDIIKRAVGFKTERDEIKVSDVKLAGPVTAAALDSEWEKIQQWQWIVNLVRNGSLGVAALVALVLGWMFLKRLFPPAAAPAPAAAPRSRAMERLSAAAQKDPQVLARVLSGLMAKESAGKSAA